MSGMRCMIPMPLAAGGNRSCPKFWGRNWRPAVPGVQDPNRDHRVLGKLTK
jgi:hypothetical protein